MPLQRIFDNFLEEYPWLTKQRLLLAVSGGVDSIVLAHLFWSNQIEFDIAHCNFTLRGRDSDEDALFVKSLSADYTSTFYIKRFETLLFSKKSGVSTQMAARQLRYDWFKELLTREYDYIVTAHHANDQLETLIFNLSKGTGIMGLRGILPVSDSIIRPLLHASKSDILDYANKNNLNWREDISNNSDKYVRNKIRHKVIPVLEEINPSILKNLQFTTERLKASEELVADICDEFKAKHLTKRSDGIVLIDVSTLKKHRLLITSTLLKAFNFNYKQVKLMLIGEEQNYGKLFYSKTHELLLQKNTIIIRTISQKSQKRHALKIHEDTTEIKVSHLTLKCNFENFSSKNQISKQSNKLTIDASLITFPLVVRKWKNGDAFIPFGMKGTKKVSDFLIDKKLNLFEKQAIYVLCSGEKIVWVVGHRPDNRFRISDRTQKIYTVEIF